MDGADIGPVEFVQGKNVSDETICANIRANAGRALPLVNFKRICVCASGPSLADHLDGIRERREAGWDVASMNGSHNFLIENGIVPDLYFQVDSRPVNIPFLRLANDHTTYVIASQCHPEIFDALTGRKVLLWQVHNYEGAEEAIREAMGGRQCPIFLGAQNVGQSCFGPLLAMGYRVWHLFGYDGSLRGEAKHAFAQPQNADEAVQEFYFPLDRDGQAIPGTTKTYYATPTMAQHAALMPEKITRFRRASIEIEVFGEGLLPDMVDVLAERPGQLHGPKPQRAELPAPRLRKRAVERLPIVTFKWNGHIPYTAADVNIWAAQVDRWLDRPSELVCITDDPGGIDGSIRTIPMWRDHFEHGRDWHRLKLFTEEMEHLIGPRFVVTDLDTVFCGRLDPLFENDHPFMAWRDPNRDQYCTALFMMDAGAYPHVWKTFDPAAAMRLRTMGLFGGYDQAWISHALPGQPRWTRDDGVLSFRVDVLENQPLKLHKALPSALPPNGARIINFHGKYNPRDAEVQAAYPWIAEHYR